MPVSSEASAVPAISRALIRLVCAAKGFRLAERMLTSAPSLISRPNKSRSTSAQSRQRNPLNGAQINHEGAQLRPERRPRLQSLRRLGLEAPGAAWAVRRHIKKPASRRAGSRGFRPDHNSRIGFARRRTLRPAALAAAGQDFAPGRRVRIKRTMRPGVQLGFVLGNRKLRRLLTLERRNAEIIRRLGRQAQLGLELGDPSRRETRPAPSMRRSTRPSARARGWKGRGPRT